MPSGFSAHLDNGNILIDADYYNLKLVRTGVSVRGAGYGGNDYWKTFANEINISCPSGKPVVLVKPKNRLICPTLHTQGGTKGFFYANANGWGGDAYGFEYAVFDEVGVPIESGNFGFQVFNAGGAVTFDARYRYLTVKQMVTIGHPPEYTGGNSEGSVAHGSIPDAWYVMGTMPGGLMVQMDVGVFAYYMPMVRQESATVSRFSRSEVFAGPAAGIRSSNQLVLCEISP